MKATSIFLLALFLVLLVNGFCAADKANVSKSSGLDPKSNGTVSSNETTGGSNLVTDSSKVEKLNGDKGDQVNRSKEGVDKNNTNSQSDSKGADNVQKGNEDSKAKEVRDRKDNSSNEVKSKDASEEGGNDEDSGQSRKRTRVEECDSSNKCMDEKKQFVACLRVPGNDSPDLSLLIQNKVKGPLTVRISAPDNVRLDKTKVQLPENKDNEGICKKRIMLRVTVIKKGTDKLITIKAGNGNCSLDFWDLIAHNSGEEFDNSLKFTYLNSLSQKSTIAFLSFAALLILASVCTCVRLRWRQLPSDASKYQRLDMELPVASVGKSESDNNQGWDNSWDDNWDDEEAPKTPSLPVTPSLSSKGLASRRLIKEGWKD